MKLNSTSQYAALIEHALERLIEPEVHTPEAKEAIDLIRLILKEIYKREGPAKEVLDRHIRHGKALHHDMTDLLGDQMVNGINGSSRPLKDIPCFDDLAQSWDSLTQKIVAVCERLLESPQLSQDQIGTLLRRAAEWETNYFLEIENLEIQAPTQMGVPSGPIRTITKGFLEDFLNSTRGPLKIASLAPVAGGYSNQTFLCTVEHESGQVEHLAVRKSNPRVVAPFLDLDQEFILLGALEGAGYPVPRPIDLGHQIPGIDDTFYTMEKLPGRLPGSFFGHEASKVPEPVMLGLADLLAQLHQIPLDKFEPFIKARGAEAVLEETVETCYRRCLTEIRGYIGRFEHLPSPYLIWILNWLERNIPSNRQRPVMTHGDFNIHNVLADSDNRITGVLDWECADFGAPEQDLAYMYTHVSSHMSWDDFIKRYHASGGRDVDSQCMIFCHRYTMLRMALALLRKNWDIQNYNTDDARFALIQLRFTHGMFKLGLDGIPPAVKAISNGEIRS